MFIRIDKIIPTKILHLDMSLGTEVLIDKLEKFLLDCDPSMQTVEVMYHKARGIFIAAGVPHNGVVTDPVGLGEFYGGDFVMNNGIALDYDTFVATFESSFIDN